MIEPCRSDAMDAVRPSAPVPFQAPEYCDQPQSADEYGLSPEVQQALDYMAENFAEAVRLKDLAELTNRSPYQMIRSFRREVGTTPHNWLIRYRISLGMSLLRTGGDIAAVALDVGFVDQAHFTKHFKRFHGETPGRFRRSMDRNAAPVGADA